MNDSINNVITIQMSNWLHINTKLPFTGLKFPMMQILALRGYRKLNITPTMLLVNITMFGLNHYANPKNYS